MVRVGGPTPASELANTYLCHPAGNELTNTPSNSREMQRHLMAWYLHVHVHHFSYIVVCTGNCFINDSEKHC